MKLKRWLALGLCALLAGCASTPWDVSTLRGLEQVAVTAKANADLWRAARPMLGAARPADAEQAERYLNAHGSALDSQARALDNVAKAMRERLK